MTDPSRRGALLALALSLGASTAAAQGPQPAQPVQTDAQQQAPSGATGAAPDVQPDAQTTPPDAPPPPPPPPEEVTVVGTREAKTGGSAHVLKAKALERFRYDDPHQVLLQVPGVYIRPEDGFGLRPNIGIRGAISDRSKKVTLMEDGVLFGPAPYSAPAAYYFPMMARMRSVRVVKGPSTIPYGPQTVGGAIDLLTHDIPSTPQGMLDVSAGQFGYGRLLGRFGASDEHAGFLIEGLRVANTGFKELDGGGDTGFRRNEWMVKGAYNIDPSAATQHEVQIKLGYGDEVSNETYLGLTDDDFARTPYRRYAASQLDQMSWTRKQIALTHKVRAQSYEITTTAYRHDLHRVWRKFNGLQGADVEQVLASPETARNRIYAGVLRGQVDTTSDDQKLLVGPNDRTFVSEGVQTTLSVRGKTGPFAHRAEYGFRVHHDSIERHHTQNAFSMIGGKLVPDGRDAEVTADNKADTTALAFHAIDVISYKRIAISPGARVEVIQSRLDDRFARELASSAYAVLLPGIGAYVGLTNDFGLLGGVHRGFSPKAPGEGSNVPYESSIAYEAGARFARGAYRVEAIGFYNDYQNLTDICTFSNGCGERALDAVVSAGKARIYGAEAFAEATVNLPASLKAPLRASYTLTRTEFMSDFTSGEAIFGKVSAGDEMPYVPMHQAQGTVGLEHERAGINASGTYVSRMRERAGSGDPGPGEATDPYFLLDLSAYIAPVKQLSLYANIRNLLGEDYIASRRPFGARSGAPRWVQAGAKVTF